MAGDLDPIELTDGEKFGEAAIVALSAIPVAGGVLASSATLFLQKRQNRRLAKFLSDLADDLGAVQSRLNGEFLRTEDFADLAEEILSRAADTRRQEILDALRAIFLNTILSNHPSYDEAEEIVRIVGEWQPRHILLIRILGDPLRADQEMGNVVGKGGGITTSIGAILRQLLPGWSIEQIDRTWNELYALKIHTTAGTHTMMTDRGIYQLQGRLSQYGQKVLNYIRNPRELR